MEGGRARRIFGQAVAAKLSAAPGASNHENATQDDRQYASALLPALRLENATLKGGLSLPFRPSAVPRKTVVIWRKGHVSMLQMDSPLLSPRLS